MPRDPTIAERAQERSVLFTNLADTAITILLVVFAITTGSLTILGEAARAVLLLLALYYAIGVMMAINRGRLAAFEFGTGKLERFVWVVVGAGLIASAVWVTAAVIHTTLAAQPAAGPLGLACAASLNAVNTLTNGVGWLAMRAAQGSRDSDTFRAQVAVRFSVFMSSVFLQITLTIAALARDAAIAVFMDGLGALFVIFVMVRHGYSMIATALPDLVDAPADEAIVQRLKSAIGENIPEADVRALQTRRAGNRIFARVLVGNDSAAASETFCRNARNLERLFAADGKAVDVTFVVWQAHTRCSGVSRA